MDKGKDCTIISCGKKITAKAYYQDNIIEVVFGSEYITKCWFERGNENSFHYSGSRRVYSDIVTMSNDEFSRLENLFCGL